MREAIEQLASGVSWQDSLGHRSENWARIHPLVEDECGRTRDVIAMPDCRLNRGSTTPHSNSTFRRNCASSTLAHTLTTSSGTVQALARPNPAQPRSTADRKPFTIDQFVVPGTACSWPQRPTRFM